MGWLSEARSSRLAEWARAWRRSRKLVVFIVFVALFLDNMLLTTVVPIIPNFLYKLDHPNPDPSTLISTPDESPADQQPWMASPAYPDYAKHCLHRPVHHHSKQSTTTRNVSSYTWTAIESYAGRHGYLSEMTELDEFCTNITWQMHETRRRNSTPAANGTINETWAREVRHQDILNENIAVGLMFASKAIVQLITNPFVGPITNRIGYSIPMFTGFVIMFISTIIFAFAEDYTVLFVARAIQGIGSACSSVSGMGMLADRYPDDRERGNAMAFALSGLALGVLVGPPFGGVMYEFVNKEAPFLMLAALALFDGLLQLTVLQLEIHPEDQQGTPLKDLLRDPYILLAAGSITFANMGVAMLEPSLPLWMFDQMDSPKWQQGAVFLPSSIAYLIGTNIFGPLAHKMGRWLSAMIGMIIVGACLTAIPFATSFNELLAPNAGWGFAIGMVDSAMMPHMGYLVDHRHVSIYGSVYAIADVAFCVGFAIGPALSGLLIKGIGFQWMMWIIAIVNFVYAPLLTFLRNPPGKDEKQNLMMSEKGPIKRITYNSGKYEQFENSDDEDQRPNGGSLSKPDTEDEQ